MQQSDHLRRLKEDFVSNLQGTSKWEVFCVISCLPLCLLIAAYTEAWLAARARSLLPTPLQQLSRIPKAALEYAIVVAPQVLLLMSFAPAEPAFLLLFLLWGSLALKLWMKLAHSPASRQHMSHMLLHISQPRKRFVSAFRGGLMMSTCLAILAVDFQAFPRRYAKTEAFGTGVMDVGVGAIVWAGGLVSAAAAAATVTTAGSSTDLGSSYTSGTAAIGSGGAGSGAGAAGSKRGSSSSSSIVLALHAWLGRLLKGLRAALPLVLLGCGRLVATSAVGYQQHLGEYGLHWNFFHTIAVVSLLTLALPVPPAWLGPLGLAVSALHQLLLSADLGLTPEGSLSSWMQAEVSEQQRRTAGFWVANKEGLGSLPGYWALHLLGASVGHHMAASCAGAVQRARAHLAAGSKGVAGRSAAAVAECARSVWSWVGCWLLGDLVVWAAVTAAEAWGEPVSRRSCNMGYVLWVCAQCLAWLLLCLMADLLTSGLGSNSSSGSAHTLPGMSARRAAAATSITATAGTAAAASTSTAGSNGHRAGRRRSVSSPTAAVATAAAPATPVASTATASGAATGSATSLTTAASAAAAAAAGTCSTIEGPVSGTGLLGGPPQSALLGGQHQAGALQGPSASSSSTSGSSSGSPAAAAARQRRPLKQAVPPPAAAAVPVALGGAGGGAAGPMRLMLAFNRNMLLLFLLANLMTGAVNLSLNTLAIGSWGSRCIVGLYMLLLCLVAVKLDAAGITLRPG